RAFLKNDTPWADNGYEVGFEQIVINDTVPMPEAVTADGAVDVKEEDRMITISGNDFEYIFDKAVGNFVKLNEVISKPLEWNVWRAPTDNDRNIAPTWKNAGYDRETTYVYKTEIEKNENSIIIKCHSALLPIYLQKTADIFAEWTVYANGTIDLKANVKVNNILPTLPRFGLRFFTNGENVKYYGYGPYESYSDKRLASYLGEFETTVNEMHEDYIKPQENGSHFGTHYVETDTLRISSDAPFSFNASHYTQEELTEKKHNFELQKSDDTILCVDYKQNGIGQNSCGPLPLQEYRFDEKDFEWRIRIEVK
ncbi:MAG: beta-galactosidase, partial [Clostridia bacterium]|nr:beta-galactosidase [Clostridia bacterium]